jgi:hypothetical protein
VPYEANSCALGNEKLPTFLSPMRARFFHKRLDDGGVVDKLDDDGDVLFVNFRTIPKRA